MGPLPHKTADGLALQGGEAGEQGDLLLRWLVLGQLGIACGVVGVDSCSGILLLDANPTRPEWQQVGFATC